MVINMQARLIHLMAPLAKKEGDTTYIYQDRQTDRFWLPMHWVCQIDPTKINRGSMDRRTHEKYYCDYRVKNYRVFITIEGVLEVLQRLKTDWTKDEMDAAKTQLISPNYVVESVWKPMGVENVTKKLEGRVLRSGTVVTKEASDEEEDDEDDEEYESDDHEDPNIKTSKPDVGSIVNQLIQSEINKLHESFNQQLEERLKAAFNQTYPGYQDEQTRLGEKIVVDAKKRALGIIGDAEKKRREIIADADKGCLEMITKANAEAKEITSKAQKEKAVLDQKETQYQKHLSNSIFKINLPKARVSEGGDSSESSLKRAKTDANSK